ncbi:lipoyl(octanoyl) transferase LipB [Effusibacillus dendaii]|uniref:Octanoyltransferase n=1 Tax=Effusibacillus dendaii TaxID=2743772 RepID=A0A7I8D6Y8_9BACL|nr:lipoyl(octanoyl) transferase LipB [Effusibacillus dendaii]BCJ85854.1 octanoyltransferase [Effusibacillus dendaii]
MTLQNCKVIDLGTIEYGAAFQLQKEAVQEVMDDSGKARVYLLEHPPVYTIGRSGTEQNVLIGTQQMEELGISLFEVDRGGDVTYHGPGQLVGYPILPLDRFGNDVRRYIRMLEEVVIRMLSTYGIESGRIAGMSGVWVGNEKISAVGVKATPAKDGNRFISSHGFSLNVNPNMDHFSYIIPCGITDKGVTSMERLLHTEVSIDQVKQRWVKSFEEVFEATCKFAD